MIKIKDNIFIEDLMLFIRSGKKRIAIIADTHIGFIRNLNKHGIFLEDNQTDVLIDAIKIALRSRFSENDKKLDSFIINGDFFHEFSKIDDLVIESARKIIRFILTVSEELIIIKGNHDKIIRELFPTISSKLPVRLEESLELDGFFITHGDKIIERKNNKKTITIIGHEHPAIRLYSKTRFEEYKAFLVKDDLIVLPSANKIIEGHDVLREKCISPYLMRLSQKEFNDLDTYIVATNSKDKETIHFHKIKDILKTQNI